MNKEPIEEPIEDKALEKLAREELGKLLNFIAGYKANQSDAVEFGKFLLANYETLDSDDMYWQLIGTNQIYTTEELYKEFKNKP